MENKVYCFHISWKKYFLFIRFKNIIQITFVLIFKLYFIQNY